MMRTITLIALPLALVRGARWRAVALAGAAVIAAIGMAGFVVVLPALRAAADTF